MTTHPPEHFLTRLDRIAHPYLEIALALYRDHDLLLHVIAQAGLPEGAERVAISLGHPVEGPFVLATRDGHLVTCLGRGMRVFNHPIVTRGRLDEIAGKSWDVLAGVVAHQGAAVRAALVVASLATRDAARGQFMDDTGDKTRARRRTASGWTVPERVRRALCQQPCECGSGLKHSRCCARMAA